MGKSRATIAIDETPADELVKRRLTKNGNPIGRRPIPLNLKQIRALARLGCTNVEIADVMGCSHDIIEKRKKTDPEFRVQFQKGRAEMKTALRDSQLRKALNGNATMQIWLGKQFLGQTDKAQLEHVVAERKLVLPITLSEEEYDALVVEKMKARGELPGTSVDE